MGKLKSDKQRTKHVYPVLEMLNIKIKGLKFGGGVENFEEKKIDTANQKCHL